MDRPLQHDIAPPAGSLFPMETMRGGQAEFYFDAKSAAGRGRILLADAPTGIGKTAASIAAALEEALPAGRKVLFLTGRNSHHIQAMIETRAINGRRAGEVAGLRPELPRIRVIDKIAKEKMCIYRFGNDAKERGLLRCELKRSLCRPSRPPLEASARLLDLPMSAMEASGLAHEQGFCAHFASMQAMRDADLIICDYRYLFDEGIRETFVEAMRCGLGNCDAIIDEAHNLPGAIRGISERKITERTLKDSLACLAEAKKAAEKSGNGQVSGLASFLAGYVRRILQPKIGELSAGLSGSGEEIEVPHHSLAFATAEYALKSTLADAHGLKERGLSGAIAEVCAFMYQLASESNEDTAEGTGLIGLGELALFMGSAEKAAEGNRAYGVFLQSGGQVEDAFSLKAVLHDAAIVSEPVFYSLHSAILMSGTLPAKRAFAELLGIEDYRIDGLEREAYESDFDPERRAIRICTAVSSRLRDRTDAEKSGFMAGIIGESAKALGDRSLAVYYPSYEYMSMMRTAADFGKHAHEVETRGDPHMEVEARKGRMENATGLDPIVLHGVMGGAYSESMDFRNNPFKLIIIAGFPVPKPTPMQIAYERYLAEKFKDARKAREYSSLLPAAIRTAQAVGRGIRKASDWCYCLLIDDRFALHSHLFPAHLKNRALTISPKRIAGDIKSFTNRMEASV